MAAGARDLSRRLPPAAHPARRPEPAGQPGEPDGHAPGATRSSRGRSAIGAPVSVTVSVVICAYTQERWDDLVAAIGSVRRQTLPPLETVVVIDHNERLLGRARRELPGKVIANAEDRGLSGSRNTGVAAALGAVVAFLDDDAIAQPTWLEHLVAPYDDPKVLGVGGTIEALWLSGRPSAFPTEFEWVVGCTYRGIPERLSPVRNMLGANMSIRREVFDAVGGFRHGIGRIGKRPVGCEETELCIRARQRNANAVFLFEPRARVRHRVPAERASWSYFRSRCYAEGLSKARVSRYAGPRDGLASERTYASRTLPRGVAAGLADAVLRRDLSGVGRAAAIIAGLAVTTTGYVAGRIGNRRVVRAGR